MEPKRNGSEGIPHVNNGFQDWGKPVWIIGFYSGFEGAFERKLYVRNSVVDNNIKCYIIHNIMLLTTQQVRTLVGVGNETLRYWRKALAPMKERRGYGPCFTPGEVLALMIVKKIVCDFQSDVAVLRPIDNKLFEICRGKNWPKLVGAALVVSPASASVRVTRGRTLPLPDGPVWVVPLSSMISSIREGMMTSSETAPQRDNADGRASTGRKVVK